MALSAAVIIPTRGRDGCLRRTIRDLDLQDRADFEVWIVDQNESKIEGLAHEVSRIKLNHEQMPPLGSHAGRNFAIAKTAAPLCIFVDDDVRLSPHFVSAHIAAHASAPLGVSCIAGRVVQPQDGLTERDMIEGAELATYNEILGLVRGNFTGYQAGFVDHMHECNFSMTTNSLRAIGGFNEEFQGNAYFEGTDLALRLKQSGKSIYYNPDIVLTHLQESAGGNREKDKSRHTYWMMRNLTLLNSLHMKRGGLPIYGTYSLTYVLAKALKNKNKEIAALGIKGLWDGLKYFYPRTPRLKSSIRSNANK